jgi:uroporphyrin-III C-methyltransferase/precorrin-2 dehydrogenase/sirohydrochlorin ferrochelatase
MTRPLTARGFVSLVGAGPGDPDLLTRKAVARLADADLVLYDALVDPETLALAPSAQRVFVGKRAGRPQVRQEYIHQLMIRAARAGKTVVRLKGGDPFVFGRGGEEGLALAAAGVSFEVVPGVSSAIAAAGLAGIPVTHRGIAAGFVVVSGHAEDAYRPVLESLAPHSATVVVMMGLGRIEQIAALMLGRGWNALTPAAVISGAGTAASNVWTATLRELSGGAGMPVEGTLTSDRQRLRPERGATSPRESERGWAASTEAPASSAEALRRRGPASSGKSSQSADANAPSTIVIGEVVRLSSVLNAQADSREAAAGGR